ncbi:MAG: UDP-N-acetylmuramate--L-alanine ligase [Fusobacteriaceae bacterium]
MSKIYFVGINGIGMSGLAKIMKIKGYDVIGADLLRGYVTEELEDLGITVYNEHKAENMKGVTTLIVSSAIKKENPEYSYALEKGIKILKRGELLGELINLETGIAVAGTHGKTTTSSMLASVMLSLDPTIVVGGILPEIHSNAKPGKSKYFIAEADESDNSFLFMKPSYSIITNIEADHLENHGSLENIEESFSKFIDQTKKEIIVCGDCENLKKLIEKKSNVIKYSLENKNVEIYADEIKIENGKTKYKVYIKQKLIGEFSISIPGKHNILNTLPVIYLSLKFGVTMEELLKKLESFKGAKRRYDILLDKEMKIIDDYAHHPTEIKATLQGALSIEKNPIVAIFQPHRYSRIKFLFEEFENSFIGAEKVLLLPVYSAGEKNVHNVTLENLAKKINHKNIEVISNTDELEKNLVFEKNKVYIFMGAGDISKIAQKIVKNREGIKNENI